jgi:hypothetical protein
MNIQRGHWLVKAWLCVATAFLILNLTVGILGAVHGRLVALMPLTVAAALASLILWHGRKLWADHLEWKP